MRQKNQCTDITLKVENIEYPAHLDVLSATSDYFERIIARDALAESGDGASRNVAIHDVKSKAFAKLLEAAYTGELQPNLEDAAELYYLSDFLAMPTFVEKCRQFICDGMKEEGSRCGKYAHRALDVLERHTDEELQTQLRAMLVRDITKHAGMLTNCNLSDFILEDIIGRLGVEGFLDLLKQEQFYIINKKVACMGQLYLDALNKVRFTFPTYMFCRFLRKPSQMRKSGC